MNKKINFSKTIALIVLLSFTVTVKATPPPTCYYQIKIYHYKTKAQEDRMDHYLKDAYLPALKRITPWPIGVFKTMEQDTDKRIYVLIPFSSYNKMAAVDAKLAKDAKYQEDGKDYLDAAYNDAPYTRFETIVLKAFRRWKIPAIPQLTAKKTDRVYELRSYESPTEKLHINKVKMFNEGGETVLFDRLKFNAVFYADVLVGSHMPNLMYMTTFNSKEDRDKHWDTFSNDPEWKTLVAKPEYQHNVSKADIIFVHPTEYSNL